MVSKGTLLSHYRQVWWTLLGRPKAFAVLTFVPRQTPYQEYVLTLDALQQDEAFVDPEVSVQLFLCLWPMTDLTLSSKSTWFAKSRRSSHSTSAQEQEICTWLWSIAESKKTFCAVLSEEVRTWKRLYILSSREKCWLQNLSGCSVTCFPFDFPLEKVGAYLPSPSTLFMPRKCSMARHSLREATLTRTSQYSTPLRWRLHQQWPRRSNTLRRHSSFSWVHSEVRIDYVQAFRNFDLFLNQMVSYWFFLSPYALSNLTNADLWNLPGSSTPSSGCRRSNYQAQGK